MRKPRFPLSLPVEWYVDGALTRYRTSTRDVSQSGVLLSAITTAPVGAPVVLLLGPRRIKLAGSVARGDDGGMAVRFAEPLDAGQRRLRRYLRTAEGRTALGGV